MIKADRMINIKTNSTMKKLFIIMITMFTSFLAVGQTQVKLDASTTGTTKVLCNATFTDDKPNGNYAANVDRWITFRPSAGKRICMEFTMFDIDASDTVIIYYGPDTLSPRAQYFTPAGSFNWYSGDYLNGKTIKAPVTDTSGCITFRLKSDEFNVAAGWEAKVTCEAVCQDFYVDYQTTYTRIDTNGVATQRDLYWEWDLRLEQISASDTSKYGYDTILYDTSEVVHHSDGTTGYKEEYYLVDTVWFRAIDLCEGDSLIITAAPNFAYNDNSYHQSTQTCIYQWSYGPGTDSIAYDPVGHCRFEDVSGYDLACTIKDTNLGGTCYAEDTSLVRIRISTNPIKTVANFPDMCSGTQQVANIGYGANSTIIMQTIEFSQVAREEYNTRTFIPDGGSQNLCYEAPVTFTTFTAGSTVRDASEVRSICINMEHSYIGDLEMSLICPNGQKANLKYYPGGGNLFLGEPLDSSPYDNSPINDTSINRPGTCWTYCFSNIFTTNGQGVIGNSNANHVITAPYNYGNSTSNHTIDSTHVNEGAYYFQTPTQGLTGTTSTTGYVVDLNGFNTLVGCPLNGEWKIEICDHLGADNGWICSWWMDLGVASAVDWDYQVPIDTVIWGGPFIDSSRSTGTSAVLAPPIDANGTFTYDITIIDGYGCKYKTNNTLNVVKTPVVDLGPDVETCESHPITLNAGNAGATRYDWEPTGETTQTIVADPGVNNSGEFQYSVQVTNYNGNLYCYGVDTMILTVHPAATAAFTTDKYPLEGCEPYSFQLLSTSSEANSYVWHIGEEVSTEANPQYTFPYGTYDVSLKVTSANGCEDSIHYDNLITVFKSPVANFGWDPSVPYSSEPTITFVNQTVPNDTSNMYRWEIQSNRENSTDIENIFGQNPQYTWQKKPGQTLAGDYNVTLDAYSYNVAPSGYVYECHDTISKVITIINDNIVFPTVITPNGDGVNDIFEIINLLTGQAFPDNELSIYNRYGKRIYFAQDIRNKEQFWDPEKTNSPTGTYFYRFIGRGPVRNVEFKGSVEVLRD